MCLELRISVPEDRRSELEASVASIGSDTLKVTIKHRQRWPWTKETQAQAYISEQGGCACSLLAHDADWGAAVWSMRPEVLGPLRRTLVQLGNALPGGFVLEALWQGENPRERLTVTARQIADIASSGKLGTRVRYHVVSGEAA